MSGYLTTGGYNVFSGTQAGYTNTITPTSLPVTVTFSTFGSYNASRLRGGPKQHHRHTNVFNGYQAGYFNTIGGYTVHRRRIKQHHWYLTFSSVNRLAILIVGTS
jgi:hypothetical protein